MISFLRSSNPIPEDVTGRVPQRYEPNKLWAKRISLRNDALFHTGGLYLRCRRLPYCSDHHSHPGRRALWCLVAGSRVDRVLRITGSGDSRRSHLLCGKVFRAQSERRHKRNSLLGVLVALGVWGIGPPDRCRIYICVPRICSGPKG